MDGVLWRGRGVILLMEMSGLWIGVEIEDMRLGFRSLGGCL